MKFLLTTFLFTVLLLNIKAQAPNQGPITVGLTSPEVASLGKFGNIPVSYSTGVPNISIPIYEISTGGIKLPISLDYHAGGIRVDEVSSSVGIGWALNAGGMISRAMIGYPDESSPGYLSSPPFDQVYNTPTNYVSFLYNNTLGLNDINPDVFSYNITGESGKFMIKKSDLSFIQFPITDNRIENYNSTNYKITDKNGVAYIFEQQETTSMGPVNQVQLIPTYTSAWRLTKIISSNNADTILLSYDIVHNLYQHNKTYSHTIGTIATCSGSGPGGPTETNADSYTSQAVSTDETYLKSITWRGGKVSFTNFTDRTDRAGAERVGEIDVYSTLNGVSTLIRQAKLSQSYFYYSPPNYTPPVSPGAEAMYRLRLDAVSFYDVKNKLPPQVYSMTYDNTPMAPRETAGQDLWGFNNGHNENVTLMPKQTVSFDVEQVGATSYFTFGDANRATDANYIKACSIQSVTYPTGGKTVYELEPHQYNTNTTQTITGTVEARATGSVQTTVTATLAVTSAMTNLRYNAYISQYNYPDVTNRPQITITDQATNQQVLLINNLNASQSYTTGLTSLTTAGGNPVLLAGHTYTLTTSIYAADVNVLAYIDVFYDTQTNTPLVLAGGGLRVKSITNYDNTGSQINKKSYTYNTDGTGTLLTPYNYFALTSQITTSRIGCPDQVNGVPGVGCQYAYGKPTVTYFANSIVPISQYTGSPVLYGAVTEYDVSGSGLTANGKKVYGYQVYQDQQVLAYNDYSVTGVQMLSNVWRNGYLTEEDTYKSNSSNGFTLISSKSYNYATVRQNTEPALRIKPTYAQIVNATTCEIETANSLGGDIFLDSYTIPYAAILLQSETDNTIDDAGTIVSAVHNNYYDDLTHTLPTRKELFNSKGDDLVDVIQYPHNLASGSNVYQTMLNRNMVAPVVSYQQLKNGVQETLANLNYNDWFSNGNLLLPQSVYVQTQAGPLENRVNFNKYDVYGNILQQQKAASPYLAYQWGYNNQYPVAEAKNATVNDIFYDSFEEGDGNSVAGVSKTGHYSFVTSSTAPYSRTLTGLDAGSYTLSYWLLSGGKWSLVVNSSVTIAQGGSYTVTVPAGNQIDDVRFFPSSAQMSTYTYDPLIGMTSTTDFKNEITYYEYDGFQRLVNIKDKDGNIIKSYCYNYAGQPYGCAVPQGSPVQPIESVSNSSFVTSNLMDNEWKQQVPLSGYTVAPDNGTIINAAGTAGANAGRFAYFSTGGSLTTPITDINGTLSFTAKGSGTIEIQLIAAWDSTIVTRKTFALTADYQNYSWTLTNLYPQLEMMVAVMVNGGNSSPQASVQFANNFSINLAQCGLTGTYQRFRADVTSLIGNSETGWYGWNNNTNTAHKKYLQHSAYARMRFQTTANQFAIEYVRDFYDRQVVNLFPVGQTLNNTLFNAAGNTVTGAGAVNDSTHVTGGQIYTISGLMTSNPACVWYNGTAPLGGPVALTNIGTAAAPVYQVTAPAAATRLGLLVQNTGDSYLVYTNCMVQQGAKGSPTANNGPIPSPFVAYSGNTPSHISGPAVFINGSLYKYYQVEGTDQSTVIQFVSDTLPSKYNGQLKTIEVMMPGQSAYPYTPLSPPVRRSGTFLRAVYFPGSSTTVYPSTTVVSNSIAYIHDSILSGYNISSDAQNNVWMMAIKRNPAYGFTGDIFSEGYAGRILYTDINTDSLTTAFAQKLASFGVNNYWFQIGVNDYGFMTPLPLFYKQYKSLIEKLEGLNPNAKIYIQSTGPESYTGPNGETMSDDGLTATGPAAKDYQDVQRALATSHAYCRYVNFEGLFAATPANTADGIHPTDAGNLLYTAGIKAQSDLLGTVLPVTPLAFYRNTTRPMIQTVSGIYTVTATGGTAPYTFSLVSGTLPSGLNFNPDGTITGTPTASGTFSLSVKVTDHASATLTETVSLTVKPVPVITVAASAASLVGHSASTIYVITGKASSITISGANGYGPYTLSAVTSGLPAGMTFAQSTGVLSGMTQVAAGTNYTFTVTATDHWGFSGSTTFTLQVLSGPPPPPTDNFSVTAAVSSNNHLIVTGHLNYTYNTTVSSYIGAYYTPTGSTAQVFLSDTVNIHPGTNTSAGIDFGQMALKAGNFTVTLANGGIYPTKIGVDTITYTASVTPPPLNATVASTTEALTNTVTYNPATRLLTLTSHLPRAAAQTIDAAVGAVVTQTGKSAVFVAWPMAVFNPGSLTSTPVSVALPSTMSATGFSIQVSTGAVGPIEDQGYFIDISQILNTSF